MEPCTYCSFFHYSCFFFQRLTMLSSFLLPEPFHHNYYSFGMQFQFLFRDASLQFYAEPYGKHLRRFFLLLIEFVIVGYTIFISFFSGHFTWLNAHSPSYPMRFLFLGIIVAITSRTGYLFVCSKDRR